MSAEETGRLESREEVVETVRRKRDLSGTDPSGLDLAGIKLTGLHMEAADRVFLVTGCLTPVIHRPRACLGMHVGCGITP